MFFLSHRSANHSMNFVLRLAALGGQNMLVSSDWSHRCPVQVYKKFERATIFSYGFLWCQEKFPEQVMFPELSHLSISEPSPVTGRVPCLDPVILRCVSREANSETICVHEVYWKMLRNPHWSGDEGGSTGQRTELKT